MKNFDYTNVKIAEIDDPVERRIMAALKASKIGVFEFDLQTDTAFWDNRVRELWGIHSNEKITYEVIVAQVHPDDRALYSEVSDKAFDPKGDGRLDMTYRLFPRDGHPMRWIRATAECFFENGVPMRLVGTVTDVTEERNAVEHNRLLVNELQHRVKNTLATASAVVSLSRRGKDDIGAYCAAVDERLRSLSASHDILRRSEWSPVPFSELFSTAAESFLGISWQDGQITANLDPIEIPAKHVMTLSMGMHELLNNAAKHGALSEPDGAISIELREEGDQIKLAWKEHSGPAVRDVQRSNTGFGSMLLVDILPEQLGGKAEIAYFPEGLQYRLQIPSFLKNG